MLLEVDKEWPVRYCLIMVLMSMHRQDQGELLQCTEQPIKVTQKLFSCSFRGGEISLLETVMARQLCTRWVKICLAIVNIPVKDDYPLANIGSIPINSIWSIPIPHQIYQFQIYQFHFYLFQSLIGVGTLSRYLEYLLGMPTQSSLYSK